MHNVSGNGAEIPAIGLGTWTLRDDAATRLVAGALEAGGPPTSRRAICSVRSRPAWNASASTGSTWR
jgi:hypothetical protein